VRVAPTPHIIRSVISTLLYKWFGEGHGIYQLQKELREKVQIPALDFKVPVQCCNNGLLKTWVGPLALFDCSIGASEPEDPFQPVFDPNSMKVVELGAKDFFEQKIAYIDGCFIRRRDVIDHARNKGGAHLNDGKYKIKSLEPYRLIHGIIFDRVKNIATVTGGDALRAAQNDISLRECAYDCVQIAVLDSTRRFLAGVDCVSESLGKLAQAEAS